MKPGKNCLQRAISEHSLNEGDTASEIIVPFEIEFPFEQIKIYRAAGR